MSEQRVRFAGKALELFLILSLAMGALLAGAVALLYRADLNSFLSELKEREERALERQAAAIGDEFDVIVGDLLFLSRQNELHAYLERKDAKALRAIQDEYLTLVDVKRIYDQIRYLNADGMEKVRVNFAAGKPRVVPEGELQNKSGRYYFADTFALGRGEVFVSPLDLNVELGEVERPLKPMIRFGTPVIDCDGNKRGVVLLNYLAAGLLSRIEAQGAGARSVAMLVNSDGYWLLHPDEQKEWGFMFDDRAGLSLANAYPREWRMIRERRTGQVRTENGLITFAAVYPLLEVSGSSSGSCEPNAPSGKHLDPSEYFWVLVSRVPCEVITAHSRALMSRLLMIGAGLFLILSYGAWQLAAAVAKRRIYQDRLVKMALTDSLTGLPNRVLFFDRLGEGIAHATRFGRKLGLLYIDLDGFKGINDTLGHDAGDELLIQVGGALKKNLRKSDTVARLGGDEFAAILFEIKEPEDAQLIGEKVVATLSRPFELKAGAARIGASVGAAVFPDHESTVSDLVKRADAAMYRAKAMGKGACVMDMKGLRNNL